MTEFMWDFFEFSKENWALLLIIGLGLAALPLLPPPKGQITITICDHGR
jgi:hypothetical protein